MLNSKSSEKFNTNACLKWGLEYLWKCKTLIILIMMIITLILAIVIDKLPNQMEI